MIDLHVVDEPDDLIPPVRLSGDRIIVQASWLQRNPEFLHGLELNEAYLHAPVSADVVVTIGHRIGRAPKRPGAFPSQVWVVAQWWP